MSQIIIRKPYSEEYGIWSKIYRTYLDFYQTSLTEDDLQRVWSWIFEENSQKIHCYFAEIDNEVVGLTHFREFLRPIKAGRGVFLDDLIVIPTCRGHGVGYQLIEAVKLYAKENSISVVRWITALDNSQAIRLYDGVANKTRWVTYDANINLELLR